jgi:Zn-dependent protease
MKWSWKLGKFDGIDVYPHTTFVLLLVWIASMHWMAGHSVEVMFSGLAFMLGLFGSVLLHEFGHALTAEAFRNRHSGYHAPTHRRDFAYRKNDGQPTAGIGRGAGPVQPSMLWER